MTAAKSTGSKVGKKISNYWTVSLGSAKIVKNSFIYKNQNFKKNQRVKKLKKGTKIKIKGLKWSNGGYPRFKVAGGYLTTNKKNTVVASAGSNKVNSYIISNYFGKHAKIVKKIDKRFPKNKLRRGLGKPEGVVVHETANPNSTLKNEVKYMKAHYKNAFVHTFVNGSTIENIANTNYLAWGAGYQANQRFIQFEQVRVHSKKNFAKEINNAAYYSAYILKEYGLKPSLAKKNKTGTLWSHNDVSKWLGGTTHTDPVAYWKASGKKWFGTNYTMKDFYKLVKAYYDAM
ncbi:N-acetylmuramoyl-L-alanine amidase [Periweissella cryptocerci]|uniref:N-acetylmuramoyl-L-alanine amidase n=2 Tax=Periweissella cryptocerci TaxID=2506420 RepID=A0A4P6YXE3_9LACO|nr:N-acetylmuramoyl-L-alanine amidase [Periweissella cryptocerci]